MTCLRTKHEILLKLLILVICFYLVISIIFIFNCCFEKKSIASSPLNTDLLNQTDILQFPGYMGSGTYLNVNLAPKPLTF